MSSEASETGARENEENPVITKAGGVKKVRNIPCKHWKCWTFTLIQFFLLSFRMRLLSPVGRNVRHLQVTAQRTVCLQTPQQDHSPLPINHDVAAPLKTLQVLPHQIKRLELQQGEGLGGAGREQHLLRIPPPQPQLIQSVARHQNSRKKQSRKERGHRDR